LEVIIMHVVNNSDFYRGEMRVKEIMTGHIAYCNPDTSLKEVARLMEDEDCGSIPVLQDKQTFKPIGIITDRDIVIRCLARGMNPLEMTAGDCMTPQVLTIDRDLGIHDCERLMIDNQVRRIVVVDQDGRCCGMVSQADIATKAPDSETAGVVERISQPVK
jgi:CBS domain-containing protein